MRRIETLACTVNGQAAVLGHPGYPIREKLSDSVSDLLTHISRADKIIAGDFSECRRNMSGWDRMKLQKQAQEARRRAEASLKAIHKVRSKNPAAFGATAAECRSLEKVLRIQGVIMDRRG